MEFLKKHWLKFVLVTFTLAGTILFIVLIAQYDASHHNNLTHELLPDPVYDPNNATSFLFAHIAGLTFFLLATIFFALSMVKQTKAYGKFVLCGIGLLCTAFMLVSVFGAVASENSRLARSVINGKHDTTITAAVTIQARLGVREAMFADGGVFAAGGDAFALRTLLYNHHVDAWVNRLVELGIPNGEQLGQGLVAGFNDAVENVVAEVAPVQINNAKNVASYQFMSRVVTLVVQLIIFGLMPLAWGVKKLITKKEIK
ncbi:MAG: hypothetical protein FWE01_00705 [Firmicutes bacterium]|nr:hypothetical protein [Bacillota bacterium]